MALTAIKTRPVVDVSFRSDIPHVNVSTRGAGVQVPGVYRAGCTYPGVLGGTYLGVLSGTYRGVLGGTYPGIWSLLEAPGLYYVPHSIPPGLLGWLNVPHSLPPGLLGRLNVPLLLLSGLLESLNVPHSPSFLGFWVPHSPSSWVSFRCLLEGILPSSGCLLGVF